MTDVLPTPTGQQMDLQADLDRARQETVGPVPLIQKSVDPTLTLPRGLMHDGTWHTQVLVRELTGVDEEALARVKTVQDMFDAVIALGTVRVGTMELAPMQFSERQGLLQGLLLGEREQLYLAVVQATYGDRKTLMYTCPSCAEEQELTVVISEDFPVKTVPDVDMTEFTYGTAKGAVLVYRPATGADQLAAMSKKGSTSAEQNTIILSRCIKSVDGQAVILNPIEFARSLPMRDRQALLTLLVERQPSVDLNVKINCVACREEQTVALGWGDLFRP